MSALEQERVSAIDRRLPRRVTEGASAPDAPAADAFVDTGSDASYGIRVVASDDNRELFLSLYNIPIPPEVGMKLASQLLDAAIRLMDRRAKAIREAKGAPSNA